jgi:hypothetical protein
MSTGGKSTAAVYLNCQWQLELGFRQGQVKILIPGVIISLRYP